MTNPFGISQFPVQAKEHRELLIAEDFCPQCGGDLDYGWECNACSFDAMPEAKEIDLEKHRRDNH